MPYPTYHNFIGGQWLPAKSGKTILNLNPADHSDVVGAFPSSDPEDVALAVAAARRPSPRGGWFRRQSGLRFCFAPALLSVSKEKFAAT